jgi:hypothetical protein
MSPPHALWIRYKAFEGDLAAAQYTGMEIREYISALQSHNEPSLTHSRGILLSTEGTFLQRIF